MNDALKLLEDDLKAYETRINDFAPWMAQILIALPKDPSYKKLDPNVREEIETIIAGVE